MRQLLGFGSIRRRFAFSTGLAALFMSVVVSGASAAPRPLTFYLLVGDSCVQGEAKSNAFLKVIVHDPAGHVALREATTADSTGQWFACMYPGVISPGYTIDAKVFSTGQTRHFVVPELTLNVNRGTDVVSRQGHGRQPSGN